MWPDGVLLLERRQFENKEPIADVNSLVSFYGCEGRSMRQVGVILPRILLESVEVSMAAREIVYP